MVKTEKTNLTIDRLLNLDTFKEILRRYESGEISNLFIIYHTNSKGGHGYKTDIEHWEMLFGALECAKMLAKQEWFDEAETSNDTED